MGKINFSHSFCLPLVCTFLFFVLDFFFDSVFHILKNHLNQIKKKKDNKENQLMSKIAYISFVVALLATVNLIPQYSNKNTVLILFIMCNLFFFYGND